MKELTLAQVITTLLTVSVRLSGLFLFAPFFGSEAIPPRVKAGLVLAVSLLFFPGMGDLERAVLTMLLTGLSSAAVSSTAGHPGIYRAYSVSSVLRSHVQAPCGNSSRRAG